MKINAVRSTYCDWVSSSPVCKSTLVVRNAFQRVSRDDAWAETRTLQRLHIIEALPERSSSTTQASKRSQPQFPVISLRLGPATSNPRPTHHIPSREYVSQPPGFCWSRYHGPLSTALNWRSTADLMVDCACQMFPKAFFGRSSGWGCG